MDAFEIDEIAAQHGRHSQPYYEFFRTTTLSLGFYVLRAGDQDRQLPHTEDEVYYVIEGKGMIQVGTEDRPVAAGSTVFVGVGVDHRFHSIAEDLRRFFGRRLGGPIRKRRLQKTLSAWLLTAGSP